MSHAFTIFILQRFRDNIENLEKMRLTLLLSVFILGVILSLCGKTKISRFLDNTCQIWDTVLIFVYSVESINHKNIWSQLKNVMDAERKPPG